jgi:TPP-dependent pyruvate/acetoin dehydrogenase alpha subunit
MKERLDLLYRMYELAMIIRKFEEEAINQYRQGNIRGYLHLSIGQEATAVGVTSALQPNDYIVSTHRGHGHALAKGHDPRLMMSELLGKETGYCRGRGGSMHVANLAQYNLGANGIVGGGLPIATGAAMGIKQKGGEQVVACFFSDGAANNGVFHESLNMAEIYKLPIIYILENNQYAVSTPVTGSTSVKQLSQKAQSYGMPGITVDGNDAWEVYKTMREPLQRARKGNGPTLIECVTYRRGGHHVNDPGQYMPEDEVKFWEAKDPILILRSHLLENDASEKDIEAINAQVVTKLKDAVQYAQESPQPSVEEFLAEISLQ